MRVSACGLYAKTIAEAVQNARQVTKVTHNHPEGIKGAEAISSLVFLAKENKDIEYLRNYANTFYIIDFTLDEIRSSYAYYESCQKTVPQAIECFLESTSFEDCIRNAISIGGDSDTIAAMAGSIAEAYYGVDEELKLKA
jgi:type I restriction enzyme M protein